jgi:hypothetical protein
VNYYIIVKLVKKEESSDKENIKKVNTAKALKAINAVKI